MDMSAQIETLLRDIAADYEGYQKPPRTEIVARMYDEFVQGLRVEEGRVYTKIISGSSVWGFINKTNPRFKPGDILKAAGYNKPALNKARGNILEGGYRIRWTGPLYL